MPLPQDPTTLALARRLVWFESPQRALSDPVRFLAYAFRHARAHEMAQLRSYLNDAQLRYALAHAPPGIIDPRSWGYWHLMLDLTPAPLPERQFGSAEP